MLAEARLDATRATRACCRPSSALLRGLGLAPGEIEGFAVAAGPARSPASGGPQHRAGPGARYGRPCLGVSALDVLAARVAGAAATLVALVDAFRGEVFCGVLRRRGAARGRAPVGPLAAALAGRPPGAPSSATRPRRIATRSLAARPGRAVPGVAALPGGAAGARWPRSSRAQEAAGPRRAAAALPARRRHPACRGPERRRLPAPRRARRRRRPSPRSSGVRRPPLERGALAGELAQAGAATPCWSRDGAAAGDSRPTAPSAWSADEMHVLNLAVRPVRAGAASGAACSRWRFTPASGRGGAGRFSRCAQGTPPARALYDAMGFGRWAVRRSYYRDPAGGRARARAVLRRRSP